MSSKAAFYLLATTTLKERDLYACRIIEKAYSNGLKIYIHTATAEEAQKFDTQLWTFRDISFVPHEIYNQNLNSKAPILIGYNTAPTEKKDMLINLTTEIPSFCQQFNHVIEIIPDDKDLRAAARKQYQTYQKLGFQMETFDIKATT